MTPFILYLTFILIAVIIRVAVQYRTTDDSGLRIVQMRSFDVAFYASIFLILGFVITFGSTILDVFRLFDTNPLGGSSGKVLGVVLSLSGIVIIGVAQLQMGKSWRVGVDPHEKTALVTHGLFHYIRNPIYSGVIVFVSGLLTLLPNPLMFIGSVIGFIGIQLQVRFVEEPQLIKYHGSDYLNYAKQVGRFVPLIGKISG
ncbi:MAG: isoprenylcysteine carboxylmethyltransferase family protein [Methylococcaceae bacterium]|nr:isoprenylcysteine carboxylmethyltransferase family protein [Methylococcaceae bacterium]